MSLLYQEHTQNSLKLKKEMQNLIKRHKFDIMALQYIDIIKLQSFQALINAFHYSLSTEIKTIYIPSALCRYDVFTSSHSGSFQTLPQYLFRYCSPIVPIKISPNKPTLVIEKWICKQRLNYKSPDHHGWSKLKLSFFLTWKDQKREASTTGFGVGSYGEVSK